jgi:hypothetical protein
MTQQECRRFCIRSLFRAGLLETSPEESAIYRNLARPKVRLQFPAWRKVQFEGTFTACFRLY